MSSPNGANPMGSKEDTAAYHKHFNPPKGGKQQQSIYTGYGVKFKRGKEKTKLEIEEDNKWIKVSNKDNVKEAEIPKEAMQIDKLLAEDATQATGAKAFYTYKLPHTRYADGV
eukprot:6843015-Ditylum_brightwellii.AAC.1